MMYLKSILVGIVAAIAASVLWILTVFVMPILLPFLMSRVTGSGSAGAGASVGSGSVLVAALVGFGAGFYWHLRRFSRSRLRDR